MDKKGYIKDKAGGGGGGGYSKKLTFFKEFLILELNMNCMTCFELYELYV